MSILKFFLGNFGRAIELLFEGAGWIDVLRQVGIGLLKICSFVAITCLLVAFLEAQLGKLVTAGGGVGVLILAVILLTNS